MSKVPETAAPQRLRCVDTLVVGRMKARLPGEIDDVLMDSFGISYNTWRKVRSGLPIRRSVAERLERRFRSPFGHAPFGAWPPRPAPPPGRP